MRRKRLDDHTADRLAGGAVTPEDAPPGLAEVAGLLQAARVPAAPEELPAEAATVASMRAVVLERPVPVPARRNQVLSRILTAKTAAAAAAGAVVLGGGAAAAANGLLPNAAQSAVSSALSHVGINVPDPDHDAGHSNTSGTGPNALTASASSNSSNVGDHDPDNGGTEPNSNANFGLCNAAEAHADNGAKPNGEPFEGNGPNCTNVTHPGRPVTPNASTAGDQNENNQGDDNNNQGNDSNDQGKSGSGQPSTVSPTHTGTGTNTSGSDDQNEHGGGTSPSTSGSSHSGGHDSSGGSSDSAGH